MANPIVIILCSICNKTMERKSINHRKCLSCSNKQTAQKVIHEKLACCNCKEIFDPVNKNQKVCSQECKKKYKTMNCNENWVDKVKSRKCRARVSTSKLTF
jgi:hypothetical protein